MASSYDFVIVGGGTAGLVVAARLSEDASKSVLVLEAGGDLTEDPCTKIPIFYAGLLGSDADWNFRSEPQAGLNGRVIGLNQGKTLGGSSAMNPQVFVPPSEKGIDSWEALGNAGWNWDTLKKYLSKAYSSPVFSTDAKEFLAIEEWPTLNEARGPIQTSFGDIDHPIRKAWAETFRATQQQLETDPFTQNSVGAFSSIANIHPSKGERSYSASAYYKPAQHRSNLQVLTNTHVEKVLFDTGSGGSSKATAVRYTHNGETKTVSASKEIILSAGVFQSPKLLELSGIGNAELLQRHGIDIVESLPGVGENLHDHLVSYTVFRALDTVETKDDLVRQEPDAVQRAMQEYMTTRNGPLASVGVHTYAYLPLPAEDQAALKDLLAQTPRKDGPSTKLTEAALLDPKQPSAAYLTALSQIDFPLDLRSPTVSTPSAGRFITFGVMLSQPLSRGSAHIVSANAADKPAVDPAYLSDPVDLEVIARHMLRIKTIAASPSMQTVLAAPLTFRDPASDFKEDLEAAKAYAQANLVSMWHLVGTCAMLPRDKGGVLDARLKVYGVDGLRVVDASAIPLVSTANTQATVYALAERAADLIKEDWKSE